jgi:hypothetical protein
MVPKVSFFRAPLSNLRLCLGAVIWINSDALSNFDSLRLTPADLSTVAGKHGLLPGLPPKWIDSGRLLERPIFAALWQVFDDWRKRVTAAPGNVPAVICICGRNGDDK